MEALLFTLFLGVCKVGASICRCITAKAIREDRENNK